MGIEVRAGDLGGFVEGEHNLSQEQEDASWIFGDAIAAGSASVDKDSCLRDEAVACDQAYVTQRSTLSGHARAEDAAYIRGAVLSESARAAGTAMLLDAKDKGKFPKLSGQSVVYGTVAGAVVVTGTAVILWEEKIRNTGRGSSGRIPFYGKPPKQTVYLYHELGRIARDFLADRGDFLGCCYFASFSGPTGGNGWRKCRNA